MTFIRRKYNSELEAKQSLSTMLYWMIENISDPNVERVRAYDNADAMAYIRDLFVIPTDPHWDLIIHGYMASEWRAAYWSFRTPDISDKPKWWNTGPTQYHVVVDVPSDVIAVQMRLMI